MGGKLGDYPGGGVTYVPGQIGNYVNKGFITGKQYEFQGVVIPSLDHLNLYDPKVKPVTPKSGIQPFFLGFEGEDIMIAEVFCSKVFSENLLNKNRITEHIKYNNDGLRAIDYCKNYSGVGDKQFGLYYRHGMWDFPDYLPDAQIVASAIKQSDIEAIIKQEQAPNSIFIDRITLGIPTEKDWIRYHMQEKYGYNIAKDIFPPQNGNPNYYRYSSHVYDDATGKFKVTLARYNAVKPIEYKITRRFHNDYSSHWCFYEDKYKRCVNGGSIYDGETHKLLEKRNDTVSDDWEVVYLNKHESASYPITVGTTYETDYEPIYGEPRYITIDVPGIGTGMYYIVHYRTDIDDVKFWIHSLNDSKYPSINNPISTLNDFDMFPIVTLRSVYTFITNYPESEENNKRVEQSEELLNHLGINMNELIDNIAKNDQIAHVRDAFFGMGVSPNNRDWAVSAALYESLNWIFKLLPPHTESDNESKYGVSFREHPFNSTVFFQYRNSTYVEGRYHVDWKDYDLWESEYSHSVQKVNVKIREWHHVKLARFWASAEDNSDYRLVIGGGKKIYEYIYSDEPGKSYFRYGGMIESGVCECDYYLDEISNGGCQEKCVKYRPYAENMGGNSGWWSIDDMPTKAVLWDTHYETTYRLRVVFQVHRNRYHYIDVVDVHQSYIIQDRGETACKNIYPDDDKFVFPLSVEVEQKLTLMEKNALLGEACYLFFYAVKWEHLEWYETGAFQTFLGFLGFVITAVVTVVSMGSMSFAGMTTMQALLKVLTTVVLPTALNFALKIIDQFISDPLLKSLVSVGVMAVSMAAGMYFGSGMKFDINLDLGLATKMAKLPMKAFEIYSGSVMKDEMAELGKQQGQFNQFYEEKMTEFSGLLQGFASGIDTQFLANLSYDTTTEMSSMLIKPDDYYNLAFANDVPSMCSREAFCQLTVDHFIKNSLKLE